MLSPVLRRLLLCNWARGTGVGTKNPVLGTAFNAATVVHAAAAVLLRFRMTSRMLGKP